MNAIHHIELSVKDTGRSGDFYERILTPLGFRRSGRFFTKDDFMLILAGTGRQGTSTKKLNLNHLAFNVSSKEEVDRFYQDTLLGIPGIKIQDSPVNCPEYKYKVWYATYFFDLDGNKLEVVFTDPDNSERYRPKR